MSSASINIVKKGFKCLRCSWEWVARKAGRPTWCPKCHHPKWDEKPGEKK
jgi:Zn finger protein HypA/HybF involved in hydrogenase expression